MVVLGLVTPKSTLLKCLWLVLLLFNQQGSPVSSQLIGDEKTIEQFLDRLLHPQNYDRRIRPFFNSDRAGKATLFQTQQKELFIKLEFLFV